MPLKMLIHLRLGSNWRVALGAHLWGPRRAWRSCVEVARGIIDRELESGGLSVMVGEVKAAEFVLHIRDARGDGIIPLSGGVVDMARHETAIARVAARDGLAVRS
jgi:hypothetical protein